ncbi:MAG: tRNA uridine-5-carboxymethylaminomethyl(34) synthesis enzyme MnmG, partial [Chloroflexi bacterium]|nr:tRNA uridine-5-carboxymethylaminomethyl(34) synthesis enzyme MnmG [Chloroflexota bacterium]
MDAVRRKRAAMGRALEWLDSARVRPSDDLKAELNAIDSRPTTQTAPARDLLRRPGMKLNVLRRLTGIEPVEPDIAEQVELQIKYRSYIDQQNQMVERARKMEGASIPDDFDFSQITGLRTEARHKLERMRPATLG